MSKVYVGDIGTEIVLDCGSDITSATIHNILVIKPDGTRVTWIGTIFNTTKIKYTTVSGDLNRPGTYAMQASISMPNWSGKGETAELAVYSSFA